MAPALKASSRPSASERIAAWAVRTLARTETFMPMKPAAPESTAPIEKPERHQPAEEVREDEKDHDADDADRGVLALEIGLRAFAHRRRDLLHPRVARIRLEHGTSRPRGVDDGEHAAKDDQPESRHCRNPGFVKRTGQEDLCTVAAAPSPIGRPKPRPKVARTLPKTVLRRNARKCPDLLNSSELSDANRREMPPRETWPAAPAHQLMAGRTFGSVLVDGVLGCPTCILRTSLSISRQVSHST